jgi:phosphatidylglycerophosphate synthase
MMIVAKQVADFITFTRASLFLVFAWLGITLGADALPLVALLMIYSWTSDSIDGTIARRSSRFYHTWIGDHDLEVDMLVALGLLVYMLLGGYVSNIPGGLYLASWILIFAFHGYYKSLGMTFQAPIYGWFLWIAIRNAPPYGLALVAWILAALAITWPRFPREVVPGFLSGFRRKKHSTGHRNH